MKQFLSILFFLPTIAYGQAFTDTLTFNKPIDTINMSALDTNEFIILDTLTDFKAFIIGRKNNDWGFKYFLVVKEKKGLIGYGFQIPIEQWLSDIPEIDTVYSYNLDHHGKDEVFIYWEYHTGSGGMNGGFSDYYNGYIIWNLNKVEYINLITTHDYSHWSITRLTDESGEETGELDGYVDESEYYKHILNCKDGKLMIESEDKTQYNYVYRAGKLVRIK